MTTQLPDSQHEQDIPVGKAVTAPPDLVPFVKQRTVLLTTYRRDGTPVGTPVHIAVDGDHAYARTYDAAWKVRRMLHTPQVTITPASVRGRPAGHAIWAHARILHGDEAQRAAETLARKYPLLHGRLIPMLHRLRRYLTVHIELRPEEQDFP